MQTVKKTFFPQFFSLLRLPFWGLKEIITPFPGPETTTSPTCDNFTKETKKGADIFIFQCGNLLMIPLIGETRPEMPSRQHENRSEKRAVKKRKICCCSC